MPVKKIFSIDLDDSQFKQFKTLFDRYQAAVAKLPQDWGKVGAAVGGVAAAHERSAQSAEKQTASIQKQAAALKGAKTDSEAISQNWRSIASSARGVDQALERSIVKMVKWGGLAGGVLGGLVGVGSLFGLERLAGSIGATRTRAMGLGISYGQDRAYDVNYSRLVHPGDIMSNVAEAKYDIASDQYKALMAAGVSQQDIKTKNTGQLFSEFMGKLPDLFKGVPKGMIGTKAQQYGLTNIASVQDIVSYLNASPAERAKIEADTQKDAKDMDLKDSVQRQWQDFITQLSRATETVKSHFMNKIALIEPDLEKLSTTIGGMVTKFINSGAATSAINWLGLELNQFAEYVGKKEFQDDVRDFAKWVGSAAKSIWEFVSFFSGVGEAKAEEAPSGAALNTGDLKPGDTYDPTTGHIIKGGATGPYTGSAGIPKYWAPDILQHAEDRLEKEAGLSPMGASALVARWTQEAPGGPSQVNSIGATGINQALGSRRPAGYASWSLDKQLDYIISYDLKDKDQARALAALKAAKTPEEGSLGAADYERAEGYYPGHGDVLSSSTPARKVYNSTHRHDAESGQRPVAESAQRPVTYHQPQHPRSVVIRNQSGANAPRSMYSVAQPYAPAAAQ